MNSFREFHAKQHNYKIKRKPQYLFIFRDDIDFLKDHNNKLIKIVAYTDRQALYVLRKKFPKYLFNDIAVFNYTKMLEKRKPAPPKPPEPPKEEPETQMQLNV